MKTMRLLLQDRVLAGAMAALVAYLSLLQGVFAGMAQGTLAPADFDPLHVICSSTGAASVDPGQNGGSTDKKPFDCPCAMQCGLASAATSAILEEPVVALEIKGSVAALPYAVQPDIALPVLRYLIGEPRAPPLSS